MQGLGLYASTTKLLRHVLRRVPGGDKHEHARPRIGRHEMAQEGRAFARIDHAEMWLYGMHLAAYSHSTGVFGHVPERNRKLLAHKSEILRWKARVDLERLAIVALSLYFKDGRAKLELGLAKGRRKGDHRQALIKKEADIEARRAISAARRERG